MQREAPSVAAKNTQTAAGGTMSAPKGKVANLTINMNIDGEKFASKVVNIVDEEEGVAIREAAYGQR